MDIKGDVVTADAMNCQKETVEKIREKGGEYILAVKENQPNLYREIVEYFEGMESGEITDIPEDVWISELEKGHGRIEKREVRTVRDINWLSMKGEWRDISTIIQCRNRRTVGGETTVTDRYYISSLKDAYGDEFGKYIRGHWSIENRLHWSLDVIFDEDQCGARAGNDALVLNVLWKAALHKLRSILVTKKRYSARKRMMRAALDNGFLSSALFGG